MPITQYNSSVRQMSQSKFDSMKNASGKIPDLANQIVMTNSEDSNISCLRTEVVYDMSSSDASKNWGYPNGIGTGVTINKDFSKYDFLVCQYLSYNNSIVGFCDLSQPTIPSDTTGRYIIYAVAYIGNGYNELIGVIDLNKSSLTTYLPGSGAAAAKIAKIYGILKTPSMIYTGDELIAGNGISIENGVISSTQVKVLIEFTKQINTNIESTSDTTITGLQYFTKKSETSKLLVFASAYIQDNTGGYGSGLRFYLDSNEITSLSNASKTHSIMQTLNNISAGQHSYNLALIAGAGKATIPSYNVTYLVVLEVE